MEFVDWLQRTIEESGLTYREIARRSKRLGHAGISHASISRVLSYDQKITADFCQAIARGLGMDVETVYRKAGLLPSVPEEKRERSELLDLFDTLSNEEQKRVLRLVRAMHRANREEKTSITPDQPAPDPATL